MTKHSDVAAYHRGQATREVEAQGRGTTENGYASSRATQMHHTDAARAADRAHAAATGQEVVYTPVGEPVFRPR